MQCSHPVINVFLPEHLRSVLKGTSITAAIEWLYSIKARVFFDSRSFIHQAMTSQARFFILGQAFSFTKEFYALSSDQSPQRKLRCDTTVTKLKTSSFVWDLRVVDDVTGQPLIHEQSPYVLVDLSTRRPVAVSEELRQRHKTLNIDQTLSTERLPWSREEFEHTSQGMADANFGRQFKREIRDNDIDHNGHVNFRVYIRAALQYVESLLTKINLKSARFEKLRILYQNEAVVGDVLNFHLLMSRDRQKFLVRMTNPKSFFAAIILENPTDTVSRHHEITSSL